jgi:hypothetical protein
VLPNITARLLLLKLQLKLKLTFVRRAAFVNLGSNRSSDAFSWAFWP